MKLDNIFAGAAGQIVTMSLQEKETNSVKTAQLCPTSETKAILATMKGRAAEQGLSFRAWYPGGCYPDVARGEGYESNRVNAHIDIVEGKWQISPSFSLG